jgi:hypothetical protein
MKAQTRGEYTAPVTGNGVAENGAKSRRLRRADGSKNIPSRSIVGVGEIAHSGAPSSPISSEYAS